MALKFKIGDKVRQVVPVIEGTVTNAAIIDGDVQFSVTWADPVTGDVHERHFTDAQIEAVPAPVEAPAVAAAAEVAPSV